MSAGTYANGRTICDADSHLMELPDFFDRYAEGGVPFVLHVGGSSRSLEPA